MNSENNAYVAAGDPVARYVKTVEYVITGKRLNTKGEPVEFILSTPTEEFDYDTAVLELYNDKDLRYFLRNNKYLIENALVKEFVGEPTPVDTTNMLTDAEIEEIATTRNFASLQKQLQELTSVVTVKRVLRTAEEVGRPVKTLELIRQRIKELET